MKRNSTNMSQGVQGRRALLLLPLALFADRLLAAPNDAAKNTIPANTPATPEPETDSKLPPGACPLNSGGPSLLGSKWRLHSVYGTSVPGELDITMEVGESDLKGFAGCNNYDARFKRVGHTGFMVQGIDKTSDGCPVLRPAPGSPTINVGDWEGSYLRTLQRAGSVQQDGAMLHFFNRSGEPSVVFTKHYGDASA